MGHMSRWSRKDVSRSDVRCMILEEVLLREQRLRTIGLRNMEIHRQSWCVVPRNSLEAFYYGLQSTRLQIVVRQLLS
jgi:hypothetical protein